MKKSLGYQWAENPKCSVSKKLARQTQPVVAVNLQFYGEASK